MVLNTMLLNATYANMIDKPRKNQIKHYEDLNRKVEVLV